MLSAGALVAAAVGLVCAVALAAFVREVIAAARRPRVTCLMLHRIAPRERWEPLRGSDRLFTLPDDSLDAVLGWLRRGGYRFVGAADVVRFARGESLLDDRSVLVTIDDGCVSALTHVLPVLLRHEARGIVFVTTDPGSGVFQEAGAAERRLTDSEIRELAKAGVEIGSHGVSHRALSAMVDSEIERELVDSKRELERVTGAAVRHFAVPANWYDARVLRIAREVGYESVFCSRPGTVQARAGAFGIPRLNIDGNVDAASLEGLLAPASIAKRRLVMGLRSLPKRIVGPEAWTALRESPFGRLAGHWLSPARMAAAMIVALAVGVVVSVGWLLARG